MDSGFTQREFGFALWWVEHRNHLRQIGYTSFIFFDAIWVVYLIVSVGVYITGTARFEQQLAQLVQMPTFHTTVLAARLPQSLAIGGVESVVAGNRNDFVSVITNPNTWWGARLSGHFVVNGIARPIGEVVLLPTSTHALVEFGVPGGGGAVSLVTDSIEWIAVRSNRPIPSFAFPVESAHLIGDAATDQGAQVAVTLTNTTPVGLRDPKFILLAYQQDRLVGVNLLSRDRIEPGERVTLTASWAYRIPLPTTFKVMLATDIFRPGAYLPLPEVTFQGPPEVRR